AVDLALTLDVDLVEVVDHDLGDRVVPEQRLERPVAEDVVGDLASDLAPLLARQRRAVARELLRDRAQDALGEVLGRLPLEELRPELRDARVVDAGLELRVGTDPPLLRVLARGGTAARDARGDRDAVAVLLGVAAVVAAHDL